MTHVGTASPAVRSTLHSSRVISSSSSAALTTLAAEDRVWGKCRLLPVTRRSALAARAQAMNLSSSGSGEIWVIGIGSTRLPRRRSMSSSASTSYAGNPNRGRCRTSEYSLRISAEKYGVISPWLIAMSSKASFPAEEIMADTRTFVSITERITSVSHAGMPKSQRRCRRRKACPGLSSWPRSRLSPASREEARQCG